MFHGWSLQKPAECFPYGRTCTGLAAVNPTPGCKGNRLHYVLSICGGNYEFKSWSISPGTFRGFPNRSSTNFHVYHAQSVTAQEYWIVKMHSAFLAFHAGVHVVLSDTFQTLLLCVSCKGCWVNAGNRGSHMAMKILCYCEGSECFPPFNPSL